LCQSLPSGHANFTGYRATIIGSDNSIFRCSAKDGRWCATTGITASTLDDRLKIVLIRECFMKKIVIAAVALLISGSAYAAAPEAVAKAAAACCELVACCTEGADCCP